MPAKKKAAPSKEEAIVNEGLKELLTFNKGASKKDPLPEGWLTPSGFAKVLSKKEKMDIRPQRIYGYVKNGKDFPSKKHTDGRVILDSSAAISWFEDLKKRKVARDKAAAEKS